MFTCFGGSFARTPPQNLGHPSPTKAKSRFDRCLAIEEPQENALALKGSFVQKHTIAPTARPGSSNPKLLADPEVDRVGNINVFPFLAIGKNFHNPHETFGRSAPGKLRETRRALKDFVKIRQHAGRPWLPPILSQNGPAFWLTLEIYVLPTTS